MLIFKGQEKEMSHQDREAVDAVIEAIMVLLTEAYAEGSKEVRIRQDEEATHIFFHKGGEEEDVEAYTLATDAYDVLSDILRGLTGAEVGQPGKLAVTSADKEFDLPVTLVEGTPPEIHIGLPPA